MDVIVEVRPGEFKPEIIRRQDLKRLVPLDTVGICWDFYDGNRGFDVLSSLERNECPPFVRRAGTREIRSFRLRLEGEL
jgi:hypothetical protein